METQLQRDPFARATLERRKVPTSYRSLCYWCGSRPGRFTYRWTQDRIRVEPWPSDQVAKVFCCVDCWRSYYA